jgi:hypothetical protein
MKRLLALLILIRAVIPADLPEYVSKTDVADKLREAATRAGCQQPVVEIESPDGKRFEVVVWCRGDRK